MMDRQFLRLLAIVVASGLALGLFAFGFSRRGETGAATPPASVATAAAGPSGSPSSSASSSSTTSEPAADAIAPEPVAGEQANATIEPPPPPADPPPTRGAANLDPPRTAAPAPSATNVDNAAPLSQ